MTYDKGKIFVACLMVALFVFLIGPPSVLGWEPSEPVELVSHSSPGTGGDIFLRTCTDIWAKNKLIPVRTSVQNLTGARGDKARRYIVVKNKGNPHVLFSYVPSQLNTPILVNSDITHRSFTPLALMASEVSVLVVHAQSPYKSLKDLVEAAREKPKQITQGGGAYGNIASLVGKMLMNSARAEISYVPYKGGGEAVVALLGRHIDYIIEGPPEVAEHVKAGNFRILGSSSKLEKYPDVRTFQEQGFNFRSLLQFRGLAAPPGIPAEAVSYYIKLLERTRETQDWKSYVQRYELGEIWISGADLAKFLDEEAESYMQLNKEIGLLK